jgi:hypothetical protein
MGDNFEVASGSLKGRTNSGLRFEVTAFRNGDDLVYLVDKNNISFSMGENLRLIDVKSLSGSVIP